MKSWNGERGKRKELEGWWECKVFSFES
jgi:hypothetical protein